MRTNVREEVYRVIDGERDYQQRKWGPTPTRGDHNVTEFLTYIRDYTEEALHFLSRNPEPGATVFARHSVRKIAALAVACMEQNGAPER